MLEIVAKNPFPALFDHVMDNGGYPKSEMGYIRAYFDRSNGRWYNTCFPVGEFKKVLSSELDDIYSIFLRIFPTVGKMTDWCRNNLPRTNWCGYDQYEGYLETPIGLYKFIMRNAPGDYNLYLHCYDKWQIPMTDRQKIIDRIRENIECGVEKPFDFNIAIPEDEVLSICKELGVTRG